jgi:hypothetical protein
MKTIEHGERQAHHQQDESSASLLHHVYDVVLPDYRADTLDSRHGRSGSQD